MDYEAALNEAKIRGEISLASLINIKKWLSNEEYREYQNEILDLIQKGRFKELNDSFYTIIPFGTGGRRGTCGVGTNRINLRTIGESAQGLSQYILKQDEFNQKKGVVIAYDTRNNSKLFAEETAKVLTANGIKTYLFSSYRSTPELSFAVRELKAIAGIVISASHNPPGDNGFKVYWKDGGQIVPPHDENIIKEVNKVIKIKTIGLAEAKRKGLLEYLGEEIDNKYQNKVIGLSLCSSRSARIVYSPLHGAGSTSVIPVLKKLGFDLHLVEEQMKPDGNFPNVKDNIPNPEVPEALELAIKKAKKIDADLALVSDPDADRLGVAIKKKTLEGKEEWIALNGNQIGALMTHFILSQLKEQDKLPKKGLIAKTIVTTDLIDRIAEDFKVEVKGDLLVGFKYIAELIENLEPEKEFIFGVEESHGYLRGTFVRDKDAAIAAVLIAELASYLKDQGKTIYEQLNELYKKYGYYHEALYYMILEGASGREKIEKIMQGFRKYPPKKIGGLEVVEVRERILRLLIDPNTKKEIRDGEVVVFFLTKDGSWRVTVRPSGTEPKMKFYVAIKKDVDRNINDTDLEQIKIKTDKVANKLIEDIVAKAERLT